VALVDPLEFRLATAQLSDDVYVVTLGGELDLANVDDVDRELSALEREGAQRVVVDLLEVPFMESRTLGVLLEHSKRLRSAGGELTLVSEDARALRVIEITGLDGHFRIERTLGRAIEEAVAEVIS
jgi:anti-anti-sigma factor